MTLKFDARLCVLLFHGEELSHAEIAEQTGIPVGTVKSHIARATPILRAALQAWRKSDG
jgi:DNA-directed RNA polymerase specialized sigma24 family protein